MGDTPAWFQIAVLVVTFLAGCGVGATWMYVRLTPPGLNAPGPYESEPDENPAPVQSQSHQS